MGFAALGVTLVLVLLVAYRRTVRDHLEAWRFQLGRRTETIEGPGVVRTAAISLPLTLRSGPVAPGEREVDRQLLRVAAREFHGSVIFDPEEAPQRVGGGTLRTVCDLRGFLARSGYRVIEQRIPRRAFVILRDQHGEGRDTNRGFPSG